MADFEFGNDQAPQLERLQNLVSVNAERGELSFDWIGPAVSDTLNKYVVDHFNDGFSMGQEDPLPVADNMAEASRLLDICLIQQREILGLESEAILSALDICLARETLQANLAIAKADLAASIKISGQDEGQIGLLERKYELQGQAIDERLKLHNRPGSSLNYGERIAFLRKIYTRNLHSTYRHLHSGWLGLQLSYGAQLPEPSWTDGRDDVVGYFLEWINRAIEVMKWGARSELVHDVILYLVNDNISLDLRTYLGAVNAGGDKYLEFELTPSHLRQFSVYNNTLVPNLQTHSVRLLAMDAAFICREDKASWANMFMGLLANSGNANNAPRDAATGYGMAAERLRLIRESRTMGLEFSLPEPGIPIQRVRFGAIPAWTGGAARDRFRPLADKGIHDVPPFGKWRMAVNQYVHGPSGRTKFGAYLDDIPSLTHPSRDLGWISDIALMLRIAIRPRYQHQGD